MTKREAKLIKTWYLSCLQEKIDLVQFAILVRSLVNKSQHDFILDNELSRQEDHNE